MFTYVPEIPEKVKRPPENSCHIKFFNSAIELINLSSILRNENVELGVHKVSAKFITWSIVYELTNPTKYKMFNVNNVVSNTDVNSFLYNPDI